jgi:hypothetical protein
LINRIDEPPKNASTPETDTYASSYATQQLQSVLQNAGLGSNVKDFNGHLGYDGLQERFQLGAWIGDHLNGMFMGFALEGSFCKINTYSEATAAAVFFSDRRWMDLCIGDVENPTAFRMVYCNSRSREFYASVGEPCPVGKTLRELSSS